MSSFAYYVLRRNKPLLPGKDMNYRHGPLKGYLIINERAGKYFSRPYMP
jgi:hypothetical protein